VIAQPIPQLAIPYRNTRARGSMASRDGYLFASFDRTTASTSGAAQTSGTLYMQLCRVLAGDTITSLSFFFVGANATPTAWYFALYSSARALLGQTADQTTTAISANSLVTINLASPVSFTSDQNVYVGVCQVAGTPSTPVRGTITPANLTGVAPILYGSSNAGLSSGTAPSTADAITATVPTRVWCAGA